jgi:hypothetical protein
VGNNLYFLSGLPRSGNTLISSLLNQNPEVYSSPISPLVQNIWVLHRNFEYEANITSKENQDRHKKSIEDYAKSFYSDINKPVIFDREKEWGTPHNLFLIKKYITKTPKIIVTVRDVLDILASMININKELYLNEMKYNDFHCSYYLSENDAIAEWLMRTGGLVDKSLLCVSTSLQEENKDIFHIVEYNDLVSKTQETMSGIYNFIGIDDFDHNLTDIKKREVDNDHLANLSEKTHLVHNSIVQSETNGRSFFSRYIIDKYDNLQFWRNPEILTR